MLYKNIVILEGKIDNDFKFLKTKEGKIFATFTLLINSYDSEYHDRTERRVNVGIRIMVFDANLVRYLKDNGAKNGKRVNIYGRLNSFLATHKDYKYDCINVVVRDIHIISTNNNILSNGTEINQ